MDGKSRYGTNRVIKDRNVLERSDSKHNEDGPEPCVSPNDDDYLLQKEKHLTCHLGTKWRSAALGVSFTSIVFTLIIGLTAFSISSIAKSSAAFGFAFDSLLDVITTIVVIWRFFGEKGEFYSWEKEKRACRMIAVCFLISGIGIFVRAVRALVVQRHPHEFVGIEIIAGVSLVLYSILSWSKIVIADKISSSSLKTDGMLMSSLAYTWNKSIWFLDASIALCIALALAVFGIRLLSQMLGKEEKTLSDSDRY
ncbi:transmembrane protein 163 isoform X2 [Exaiptasia diaphana]|uniref:Transmembrane protein 163 n=1 Tax=Exaiptasia diaphana TaxID=2652724 RepID=A0A913YS22_EXADI|nr:transmembrane protein 163 isoform X2 [Exaiptasia diaphana]